MYQTIITDREAGQRFDKYLRRILPNAGSGFLYKMLRKKNITLNDKKADGSEKTAAGDCVKIFFSEETLSRFMGRPSALSVRNEDLNGRKMIEDAAFTEKAGQISVQAAAYRTDSVKDTKKTADTETDASAYRLAYRQLSDIRIICENDHVLIADKPAGVLSQKAQNTDISLNEWLIGYLLQSGFMTADDLRFFKPSVCNRLDRNTSGIVLCAKSLQGAQLLGTLLKERTLHKYYQTYVKGRMEEARSIEGFLSKDGRTNRVMVSLISQTAANGSPKKPQNPSGKAAPARIRTAYRPLRIERDKTLLEVELVTGKPHQIRAHLAGIGHPLLGDYKYGDKAWNETYRRKYGIQSQLLHAYKVVFPPLDAPFADLGERTFYSALPEVFGRVSDVD